MVATKDLLEILTDWSCCAATEGEVSDVYVRLGYQFNMACRAFDDIGVATDDLGPVPEMLRKVLENTLSQDASQASLDRYLPNIREIIINLLHGLKKKQARLRQKGPGEAGRAVAPPPRYASMASNISGDSHSTQQVEDTTGPARQSSARSYMARDGERPSSRMAGAPGGANGREPTGKPSPPKAPNPHNSVRQPAAKETITSDSSSSLSSNTMQNIPVIAPYPEQDILPSGPRNELDLSTFSAPPPPPPPPKENDALSALQRGGDLERRASRRFSAYQIQKHLGTSMNGIAPIPPAQHSPVPNRGRDARESMNAVRSRGNAAQPRTRSRKGGAAAAGYEDSPSRLQEIRRISEEPSHESMRVDDRQLQPVHPDLHGKELAISTDANNNVAHPPAGEIISPNKISATLNGPLVHEPYYNTTESPIKEQPASTDDVRTDTPAPVPERNGSRKLQRTPPQSTPFELESSPQQGKELTLFLQYKSKIKKFVLPDGGDLTLARLQLAFIEKFAWSTQNHGVDLPEIYVQDPVSGVRHELEDLSDVKERSVLVLNVEALDEVKRHFDDGIGGLRRVVEGIKTGLEDQQSALQVVSERQQETARSIAGMAAVAPSAPAPSASGTSAGPATRAADKDQRAQLKDLQSLRCDLAVVRQTYTSFVSDVTASMSTIRTQAASVKQAAVVPPMDPHTGRAYVNKGKDQLSTDSEKVVNTVDDLQDMVEDLRKDVVTRGVRPLPRQLDEVGRDIAQAVKDLNKLKDFLRREKPVWTKIWEKELQVVCDDRDLLTLQEELAVDLDDDLAKASATFALVEQATKQQSLQKPDGGCGPATGGPTGLRSSSRSGCPGADPLKAKDSVLGEVRALQPNHETRLEAIARAERARQRELESRRGGEFQRELGSFVDEGKLKKTGGVEEVERVRRLREDQARKEVLERHQQRLRDRQAAADAAAAAPAPDTAPVPPAAATADAAPATAEPPVDTASLEGS